MSISYAELLPGVPYVESPFFDKIMAEKAVGEPAYSIAKSLNE
jgi:hypothetical protein